MNKQFMDYMGNTPMIKLKNIVPNGSASIYIKLEGCNPGGSKKSRVAMQMILNAEKNGILDKSKDVRIIEPTGGNTGLGLTLMGIHRGYNVTLVIPDNYSKQNIDMLKLYGADVILSDSKKGNDSHIKKVKEIVSKNPNYVWLDQLSNKSNPEAHYNFTGKEISEQVPNIDCFVSAVGSGGTITGVGTRLKEKNSKTIITAIQPEGCHVLEGIAIPHKIQGISIGLIPPVFDTAIVDRTISIKYSDVVKTVNDLLKKEGLFLGISSCANVLASLQMAKELGTNCNVVTISPDFGNIYPEFYKEVYRCN